MLKANSRIELVNGIRFYEQDILYDDYVYTGSCQVEVDLNYYNNGFGIVFINATSNIFSKENSALLFRLNHKSLEIIYKENSLQKILGTYSSAYARTCTDNLKMIVKKVDNKYTVAVGDQVICTMNSDYEFNDYFIGYYSNKDNIINNINIASTVPYGWIVNMHHTNGGYIDFHRDGFELKQCNGLAEVEQIEIFLEKGTYYLKYVGTDTDIKPYVMLSYDERIDDDEKNILNSDGSFYMHETGYISIKFKGSYGKVNNIAVTTSKFNDYIRTSPDFENVKMIDESYLEIKLQYVNSFEFIGVVNHVPGESHVSPSDYAILKVKETSYGLYDLNLATGVAYKYEYSDRVLTITNARNGNFVDSFYLDEDVDSIIVFMNLNGKISDFIITNTSGETTNVTIENTIKEYVPGVVKSPIVVLDENDLPLDLSSSYRYYYKNDKKYYWFTNTEREYFKPAYSIILDSKPADIEGSITVYGIKHNSKWDVNKLLEIENENFDSLNACADSYDIIFEENLRYLNKTTGEIRLEDISNYQYIVVDYLKDNSYCLNYRYHLNSYEVDISVGFGKKLNMIYDNIGYSINDLRFINEERYVNTNVKPTLNGYVVIGSGQN